MLALARRPPQAGRLADVNGSPGLLLRDADGILTVVALTIDHDQITAIDVIRNPDKLSAVPPL
jgi:RNA polymerase sigma-70 factor (ECF subfamily)